MMGRQTGTENEPIAMQVVHAVARERDVDPTALTPPLGSVVDPDAIDALASADAPVTVQFTYGGCRVTVTGDRVTASPVDEGR